MRCVYHPNAITRLTWKKICEVKRTPWIQHLLRFSQHRKLIVRSVFCIKSTVKTVKRRSFFQTVYNIKQFERFKRSSSAITFNHGRRLEKKHSCTSTVRLLHLNKHTSLPQEETLSVEMSSVSGKERNKLKHSFTGSKSRTESISLQHVPVMHLEHLIKQTHLQLKLLQLVRAFWETQVSW